MRSIPPNRPGPGGKSNRRTPRMLERAIAGAHVALLAAFAIEAVGSLIFPVPPFYLTGLAIVLPMAAFGLRAIFWDAKE